MAAQASGSGGKEWTPVHIVETVLSGKDRPFGVRLGTAPRFPPVHPPDVPILVIAHERGAAAFGPLPRTRRSWPRLHLTATSTSTATW
jgi:hypothetical protein